MKPLLLIISLVMLTPPVSAEGPQKHLYLCRSPLLAFDFWGALQNMQQKGVYRHAQDSPTDLRRNEGGARAAMYPGGGCGV
jgi:hypothetical protein